MTSTKHRKENSFEFVELEEKDGLESEKDSPARAIDVLEPGGENLLTYTVEDAVEAAGCGCFQFRIWMICGILMSADAMEMLLLSILGPALRCQWQLSSNEVAAITTVVFVGYFIGSPIWGYVSDKFGRWPTVFTVLSMISYYGFLTAASPNYLWILVLRFMVGFAIGGGSSSFMLLSEFLPVKHRARVLIAFQIFWAIGSTLEVGLAYLILPRFGWRWLVFASAVPLTLFLILLKFLPESPRYLVTAGNTAKAEVVIKQLFAANRTKPIDGRLIASPVPERQLGHVKQLFSRMYLCTSLVLPMLWFTAAFIYYGIVLLSAEIFRFRHECFGETSRAPIFYSNSTHSELLPPKLDTSCCKELSDDDFIAMLISSVGEFLNAPLIIVVIDFFGRKATMATWNGLTGAMFFLLYVCMSKKAMTGVLFMVRAFTAGLLSLTYLYTTEVYPTTVRAIAVGLFSSISRLGAITTPYVAQVMMPEVSQIGALAFYASAGLVCCVLSILLPIETAGRELPNTVEESKSEHRAK